MLSVNEKRDERRHTHTQKKNNQTELKGEEKFIFNEYLLVLCVRYSFSLSPKVLHLSLLAGLLRLMASISQRWN